MSLDYRNQIIFPVLGTKDGTTTTGVALTSAYNGTVTKSFAVAGYSHIDLAIKYAQGSAETGNSFELKIEQSPDGTNWYRIPNEAISTTTSTLYQREFTFTGDDAGATTISIGLDIAYMNLKVSAKETGVTTNAGTIYCEATLSGR